MRLVTSDHQRVACRFVSNELTSIIRAQVSELGGLKVNGPGGPANSITVGQDDFLTLQQSMASCRADVSDLKRTVSMATHCAHEAREAAVSSRSEMGAIQTHSVSVEHRLAEQSRSIAELAAQIERHSAQLNAAAVHARGQSIASSHKSALADGTGDAELTTSLSQRLGYLEARLEEALDSNAAGLARAALHAHEQLSSDVRAIESREAEAMSRLQAHKERLEKLSRLYNESRTVMKEQQKEQRALQAEMRTEIGRLERMCNMEPSASAAPLLQSLTERVDELALGLDRALSDGYRRIAISPYWLCACLLSTGYNNHPARLPRYLCVVLYRQQTGSACMHTHCAHSRAHACAEAGLRLQ